MTDVQREALAVLADVWSLSQDIRLGQLMAHLGLLGEAHLNKGLGDLEDDEFVAILYRHRTELLAQQAELQHEAPQPWGAVAKRSSTTTTDGFDALDRLRASVSSVAIEPAFSTEIEQRLNRTPRRLSTDAECLEEMASMIAFSQGARADLVEAMINAGNLNTAFAQFDVAHVASMEPDEVIANHWPTISCIRFKKKVKGIIEVAKALKQFRADGFSLRDHLNDYPAHIQESSDIAEFWRAFDALQERFRSARVPYFGNTTTLLHFLLHFGFDCLKPDLIVQNAAIEIGILAPNPRDRDLRELVRTIQGYSISRGIRPSVVDLYLLTYGGQTWAKQFAKATPARI